MGGAVSLIKRPADKIYPTDETTKRLCAGTYLDRDLRDTVIRKIHNDPGHRVAPSYGFDLIPVVDHAWRAWALETAQQICSVAVLVIGYAHHPSAAVTAVGAVALWYLLQEILTAAPELIRLKVRATVDLSFRRHGHSPDLAQLRQRLRLMRLHVSGGLLALSMPVVSAVVWQTPLRDTVTGAMPLVVLLASVRVATAILQHRTLTAIRATPLLRPTRLSHRQREIQQQQADPLVVYRRPRPKKDPAEGPRLRDPSADEEPTFFVGSGTLVHRWLPPLAVQLLRSKRHGSSPESQEKDGIAREYVESPFQAHELVDHLRNVMRPLGHAAGPNRLPGFRVRDRVYIAEQDLGAARSLLHEPLGRQRVNQIINDPHGAAHHYLEISTTASGELVTTVFLRVTVEGRSLRLDFATCALTRTPQDYAPPARHVHGVRATVGAVTRALRDLPEQLGGSWRLIHVPLLLVGLLRTWYSEPPGPLRRVTVASTLSIREDRAISWRDADFDKPTILGQMKIIELRLLTATEDFLRSRDVDTSTFRRRAETIISANVLNMGGRVDIRDSAIGENAQINNGAAVPGGPATPASEGTR